MLSPFSKKTAVTDEFDDLILFYLFTVYWICNYLFDVKLHVCLHLSLMRIAALILY